VPATGEMRPGGNGWMRSSTLLRPALVMPIGKLALSTRHYLRQIDRGPGKNFRAPARA